MCMLHWYCCCLHSTTASPVSNTGDLPHFYPGQTHPMEYTDDHLHGYHSQLFKAWKLGIFHSVNKSFLNIINFDYILSIL